VAVLFVQVVRQRRLLGGADARAVQREQFRLSFVLENARDKAELVQAGLPSLAIVVWISIMSWHQENT